MTMPGHYRSVTPAGSGFSAVHILIYHPITDIHTHFIGFIDGLHQFGQNNGDYIWKAFGVIFIIAPIFYCETF